MYSESWNFLCFVKNQRKHLILYNYQIILNVTFYIVFLTFLLFLTGKSFKMKLNSQFCFETGTMPTSTKSWNQTILGSRDPDSTQLSHPSRFCHWHPLFGDSCYPPFKSTTQKQNLFLRKDFYFLTTQAQKTHLIQLGNLIFLKP